MVTYKNTTGAPLIGFGGRREPIPPGETIDVGPTYVLDPKGMQVVAHIPKGANGRLLYSGAPNTPEIEVYSFRKIVLINDSGARADVQSNDDDVNLFPIMSGGTLSINNDGPKTWHTLKVVGAGAGDLIIVGY